MKRLRCPICQFLIEFGIALFLAAAAYFFLICL